REFGYADGEWGVEQVTNYPYPAVSMRAFQKDMQAERVRQEKIAGRMDAEETFKYLMQRVRVFQSTLPADHEIGIQLANYGVAQTIHIRSIGYRNPNLIEFYGILPTGEEIALIQHLSQLNFLLVAVSPLKDEPYRIGFDTTRPMEDDQQ
ncbi:MAG: DUF6173 family protein, partial [Albidovulum sp.]